MSHVSEPSPADRTPQHAPAYVSVVNELPEDLYDAMREFVRTHPQWDQYRLMQASLAGFLFQHGSTDRAVSRHYLNGLFRREASQPPAPLSHPAPQIRTTATSLVNINPNQRPVQEPSWPAAA
ncbi:MAG: DUF2811 domain-containing protein [Cyanobium sp.]